MNKKYKNSKDLDFLLKGIYEGNEDLKKFNIRGLALDSRKVQKGFLFVALKGSKLDGNQYIYEGIQNGAEAVLTDNSKLHENNIFYVKNLREELGRISSRFYDHPSSKLMTSSYQSTAFQSSAKPVDIFVAEPSVLPKTGAEELASVLAAQSVLTQ